MGAPRSLAKRLDRARSALIVIDVQNDFCHPSGVQGVRGRDLTQMVDVVAKLEGLIDGAREYGVPVVFVQTVHDENTDTPNWLARNGDEVRPQSCLPESWGAQFFQITPIFDEKIVTKHRYSAFHGTDLELHLTEIGRDSLLFAGVSTAVCVETSLRDAVCRDFLATLVNDCCSAYDDTAHERSVAAVQQGFGSVASSQEILSFWNSSADSSADE